MTKRIGLSLVTILTMSMLHVRGAEAPTVIDRPAADAGPTEVSVGIWIVDISNIDSAQQNFTAEIALVLRWKDPRLAHTGSGVVRYPLEQVWHPALVSPTKPPPSFASSPTGSKSNPSARWFIVRFLRERSRNHCGCNHSPSTGRNFTSSSSL